MNNAELYIAGQKIEIDDSQVIALTKQIAEIGEIQSRQANLTNTFRTRDEKAVAFVSQPGIKSKYPYRFLPARLVQNGFEIIRNGNALIKSAGEQGVEITIYWGNNDFFDRLNFKLSELDLSDLNHVYHRNSAVTLASQRKDLFYPFIEYGLNSTYFFTDNSRDYVVQDISRSAPAIKAKALWDRIFQKIGFTYSMTDNPVLNKQAMQLTTKKGFIQDKTPYLVSSQNTTDGSGTFFFFTHNVILKGNDDYFPRNDLRLFRNAAGFSARFKFRLILNMDYEKGKNSQQGLRLKVNTYKTYDGARQQSSYDLYTTTFPDSFFGQKIHEFEVDLSKTHSPSDIAHNAFFEIYFWDLDSKITVRPGSTCQLYDFDLPELEINDPFDVANNMPDITAYQFVQNIARQHGMIFDTKGRHVNVITYDDVLKSKTEKRVFDIDILPGSIVKEFNPGNYYQNNNIVYSEGVNASSSFPVDNKTLPKSGDLIKLEFYLPGFVEKIRLGQIMSIPLVNEQQNQKTDFKVPPIFTFEEIPTDLSSADQVWPAYSNGQTTPINVALYQYRADVRGVTPSDLAGTSYRALRDILHDFEMITISVYMNEQEFFGLKMYTAYYVPLLHSYVYIQKISNFVKGRPVKITLIKI